MIIRVTVMWAPYVRSGYDEDTGRNIETPTLNYREAFITQSNPVQVFENTFEPIFC